VQASSTHDDEEFSSNKIHNEALTPGLRDALVAVQLVVYDDELYEISGQANLFGPIQVGWYARGQDEEEDAFKEG